MAATRMVKTLTLSVAAVFSVFSAVFSIEAQASNFVPEQVLVQFESDTSAYQRAQLRQRLGVVQAKGLGGANMSVFTLEADTDIKAAIVKGSQEDTLLKIEPNYYSQTTTLPNDPSLASQWYLHNTGQTIAGMPGVSGADIGAARAWDLNVGSPNVIVAVIDTGIDLTHPDLISNIYSNPGETGAGKESNGLDDDSNGYIDDWRGWDFFNNDSVPDDLSGHGTQMAGIIGATGNNGIGISGAGQNIRLLPLRAGNGTTLNNSDIVSSIHYAAGRGAQIVNMSFTSTVYSGIIDNAIGAHPDVLYMTGAGNSGVDVSSDPHYPCSLTDSHLLCVAATTNQDQLAGFSNFSSSAVDLGAPGDNMLSTNFTGGYNFDEGTSQATASASGAAALLLSSQPGFNSTALRARLLATTDDAISLSGKTVAGGRISAGNATDFVAPQTTLPSPPPSLTNQTQPSASFSSNESNVRFQCQIDSGAWLDCTSPYTLPAASDGSHTFRVRAIDGGNNTDSSPSIANYTIDTVAPNTTLDNGPSGIVTSADASFETSSNEAGFVFECQLDQQGWVLCPGGSANYSNLLDGEHIFQVRAVDQAGNVDSTPSVRGWIVNTHPPSTTITVAPPALTNSINNQIVFNADEPAEFQCNLNNQGWLPCASPFNLFGQSDGSYQLQIRAIDSASITESTPETRSWTIDTVAPPVSLFSAPPASSENSNPAFGYNSEAGASFHCQLDNAGFVPCPIGGVQYFGIPPGIHSFAVRAVDNAGNFSTIAVASFQIVAPPLFIPPPIGDEPDVLPSPDINNIISRIVRRPAKTVQTNTAKAKINFSFGGGQRYRYILERKLKQGGWMILQAKTINSNQLTLNLQARSYRIVVYAIRDNIRASHSARYGFTIKRR